MLIILQLSRLHNFKHIPYLAGEADLSGTLHHTPHGTSSPESQVSMLSPLPPLELQCTQSGKKEK